MLMSDGVRVVVQSGLRCRQGAVVCGERTSAP